MEDFMSLSSWGLLIVLLDGIICAGLASYVAEKKGYSSGSWGACGFLFGILGLIAAAGLPSKLTSQEPDTCIQKACPDCAEMIKAEASVCRYCHHKFSSEEVVEELVSALEDDDFETRVCALDCLADLSDAAPAVPHIVEALENAFKDFALGREYRSIQDAAADALSQIDCDSVVDHLMPIFDKDCDVRAKCKAVEILGELGERGLPHIRRLAESEDREVRQVARKTLSLIKNESQQ
jgi:HEAT repeat protein